MAGLFFILAICVRHTKAGTNTAQAHVNSERRLRSFTPQPRAYAATAAPVSKRI
jgi:uncharacterized membrane protein